MKKIIALLLVVFNIAHLTLSNPHGEGLIGKLWRFEFGNDEGIPIVENLEGRTRKQHTQIKLPVASHKYISYVLVTVTGKNMPQVNFDHVSHKVCINFEDHESPHARYSIMAKGLIGEESKDK